MMEHQPPLIAKKADLRDLFSRARTELSTDQYQHYSQQVRQQLLTYLSEQKTACTHIHLFLPIEAKREVDLRPLLPTLWQQGIKITVPRVVEGSLEHVPLTAETELEKNHWGIWEPARHYAPLTPEEIHTITTVITPLLTCDLSGNRVGYGGGFYDQFFKEYPQLKRVGIGLFPPVERVIDSYSGDIPLDDYLSPKAIIHFQNRKERPMR